MTIAVLLHKKLSSPYSPSRRRRKHLQVQAGMSLVEVMLALALVSIVLLLVSVSGVRQVEQWEKRTAEVGILEEIRDLRRQAIGERRTLYFDPDQLGSPSSKIEVVLAAPIAFSRTGLCSSSHVSLKWPDGSVSNYVIAPPKCTPVRQEGIID